MRRREFWVGTVVGALAVVLVGGVGARLVGAAQMSGTATLKYTAKVVLENDRVRVRDVTFPPGVLETGMHTHEFAHVGVILTKGALMFSEPGGKREKVEFDTGSVGFREANVTHQVGNPGTSPMRVIEVELK
jgi:quercetin dioxygenase-like cupin family protein